MGKVIDIEQRRRTAKARPTAPGSATADLQAMPLVFTQAVLLPSATFWRLWFATWSSFWLAPIGLEMRPIDPSSPPAAPSQINRNR
ncbi:MAG: hypothetical protein WAS21_16115 [Geminicoccaceae bacterium]